MYQYNFAEVSFVRNYTQESGGAVYARDSQIIISTEQRLSFGENQGYNGGALTLGDGSIIYLETNSSITLVRNHAYHYGGAIYCVNDYTEDYADLNKCFYGILSTEVWAEYATLVDFFDYIKKVPFSIDLFFILLFFIVNGVILLSNKTIYNNTADFAGTAVYGIDLFTFHVSYQN